MLLSDIGWMEVVVGAIFGLIISHFYYVKAKPGQILSQRLISDLNRYLPQMILPATHSRFFAYNMKRKIPSGYAPEDSDIPHIEWAIVTPPEKMKNHVVSEALIRFIDTGLNFDLENGLEIRDHRGNPLAPNFIGMGHVTVQIFLTIEDMEEPTSAKITVRMEDKIGKHLTQDLYIF